LFELTRSIRLNPLRVAIIKAAGTRFPNACN
jgi:hypothetical protein